MNNHLALETSLQDLNNDPEISPNDTHQEFDLNSPVTAGNLIHPANNQDLTHITAGGDVSLSANRLGYSNSITEPEHSPLSKLCECLCETSEKIVTSVSDKIKNSRMIKCALLILVELVLVLLYLTKFISNDPGHQFGLGLLIVAVFGIFLHSVYTREIPQPQEEIPVPIEIVNPNPRRRERPRAHPNPQNETEDIYDQMLRRILVSRVQLSYMSRYLQNLNQNLDSIDTMFQPESLNNDPLQVQIRMDQAINFTRMQMLEDFIFQTNLLNNPISQPQLSQPQGLSVDEIDRIMPVKIFQQGSDYVHNDEDEENKLCCTICLEDFKLEQEVRTSPCLHTYHNTCIETWLKMRTTCPNCKREFKNENGDLDDFENLQHLQNDVPAEDGLPAHHHE